MSERRMIADPRAAETAPVASQQIGRHAALIEEHVLAHVAQRLPQAPVPPRGRDISAALFVGVYRFF